MTGFLTHRSMVMCAGRRAPGNACRALWMRGSYWLCHGRSLLFLFFLLFFFADGAMGQYYIRGQDPSGIDWKQIKTPHFRVIFPSDYVDQAAYVADILEFVYEPVSASLGHRPRRVPVILHNRTVVPNGFVSWAPSRIEMFSNPPPDNDPHGWLERLAVHEFRHVVQVDKLNQGVTGIFSTIFGEHATGLALGLFVPQWFLEGDAVVAETAFTHGGRGRLPTFERGLRAQVLEKEIYSYDKASLGSYKDHVPNHYELGYQLTAAARSRFGKSIWDDVLDHVTRRPHAILPFSLGLRDYAGVSVRAHYDYTFSMLESAWQHQEAQHAYTSFQPINQDKDIYTHYRPVAFLDDFSLLVLKSGIMDIPQVIMLHEDGREEVLFTPGPQHAHMFSMGDSLLVWTEIRQDPRWEHRSWSEVYAWHHGEQRVRRITDRTRYFAAAASPCDTRIAVARVAADNAYAIKVIDAKSGTALFRISDPDNAYLMQPQWHPEKNELVAIAQDERGKRIISVSIDDQSMETLFEAGYDDISRPRYLDSETLVFHGTFSGIDNIYALHLCDGQVEKLISARFGAYDLLYHEKTDRYAWSDYTAMGYQAVMREGRPRRTIPLAEVENHAVNFYRDLAAREDARLVTSSNIPGNDHEVQNYSKLLNLFRFHSWGPFTVDVEEQDINPGVSVFSQNDLSTSVFAAGYAYDIQERLGKYYLDYSYQGWYPKLDVRAETGLRRSFYLEHSGAESLTPFLYRERSLKTGLRLPLRFRHGAFVYGLTPEAAFRVIHIRPDDDSPYFFRSNDIYPFEYRLFLYWQRRMVPRDLRPRWGYQLDLQYRHSMIRGGDIGAVMSGRLTGFFPGLFRHHHLRLSAAMQKHQQGQIRKNTMNYRFPSLISYPRGFTTRRDDRLWIISADYALPLWYPDLAIPYALYLKRFYLNVFGDYAAAKRPVRDSGGWWHMRDISMYSVGADLMANVHLIGVFTPVELGFRTAYIPREGVTEHRFLVSIQL